MIFLSSIFSCPPRRSVSLFLTAPLSEKLAFFSLLLTPGKSISLVAFYHIFYMGLNCISTNHIPYSLRVLSLERMRGHLSRGGRIEGIHPLPPSPLSASALPPSMAAELFLSLSLFLLSSSLFPVHSMEGQRAQIIAPECLSTG